MTPTEIGLPDRAASDVPVVITGAGLVSPLGLSVEATWRAVVAGQCGFRPLTALEQEAPNGGAGGQAPDLPDDFLPGKPREVRYLRHAIDEALNAAGVDSARYPSDRCGFMLGTTLHGMRAAGKFLRSNRFTDLGDFLAGSTLQEATNHLAFSGLAGTNCSACSSSLGSIALAVSLLRAGQLDLVVAGGYDAISEYVYAGFNSLRLVAPGPLRPFTRGRQGMKLAEGYGIVVLERAADARRRGAPMLATVLGYGESADAHHLTQPHPTGEGAARAMSAALDSAGLTAADIDMISAHATGTPDNDAGEYAALSRVFGDDLSRVPVVAFKSHLGHTLGGAGAVELILSAMSLKEQTVPACVNVSQDEIEFPGLRVAMGKSEHARIRATLNTSLGFGGANTSLVLGPPPTSVPSRATASSRTRRDVFITGVGIVLPGLIGNEAFVRALREPPTDGSLKNIGPIPEGDYIELLNARRVRRMSDYVKLSLAATMLACRDANIADIPAFAATCAGLLGSMHGSANYSETYYRQIVKDGIPAANPALFAEGVPNAAAAHLSLMLSLKGPCQTIIGTRTAGLDALHLAATRIAVGEWDRAIVSAGEELSELVNAAYRSYGLNVSPASGMGEGFASGCGAITFLLESARSVSSRGAQPKAKITGSTGPFQFSHNARRRLHLFDDVSTIFKSSNDTWLDRLEESVISENWLTRVARLNSLLPDFASVTPFCAIAASILTGKPGQRMGILCSDYMKLLSAAVVEV